MSTFSNLIAAPTAPPALAVLPLPASAWATAYRGRRPETADGADTIGLRLPSVADLEHARRKASRLAWRAHPEDGDGEGRIQVYNERVMAIVVARGTCRPDDARLAYFPLGDGVGEELPGLADDVVPLALTVQAVEWLYEEIDRLMVESSPVAPLATVGEVRALARGLEDGSAWEGVSSVDTARARRLLLYVARILGVEAGADDDVADAAE